MKTAKSWDFYYEINGIHYHYKTASFISPERSAIWKELKKKLHDGHKIGYRLEESIKVDRFEETGIINDVCSDARYDLRDSGTCVLGMRLRYAGRTIQDQLWQGNTPNYTLFERIKTALIEKLDYKPESFSIDHGHMD